MFLSYCFRDLLGLDPVDEFERPVESARAAREGGNPGGSSSVLRDQLVAATSGWQRWFPDAVDLLPRSAAYFAGWICECDSLLSNEGISGDLNRPEIIHSLQFGFDLIMSMFFLDALYEDYDAFREDFPLVSQCFRRWDEWFDAYSGISGTSLEQLESDVEFRDSTSRAALLTGYSRLCARHGVDDAAIPPALRLDGNGKAHAYPEDSAAAPGIGVGRVPRLRRRFYAALEDTARRLRNVRSKTRRRDILDDLYGSASPRSGLDRVRLAFSVFAINLGLPPSPEDSILERACLHLLFDEITPDESGVLCISKEWKCGYKDEKGNRVKSMLLDLAEWNRKEVATVWGSGSRKIRAPWRTETRTLMAAFRELRRCDWLMVALLYIWPTNLIIQKLDIGERVCGTSEWATPQLVPRSWLAPD